MELFLRGSPSYGQGVPHRRRHRIHGLLVSSGELFLETGRRKFGSGQNGIKTEPGWNCADLLLRQ